MEVTIRHSLAAEVTVRYDDGLRADIPVEAGTTPEGCVMIARCDDPTGASDRALIQAINAMVWMVQSAAEQPIAAIQECRENNHFAFLLHLTWHYGRVIGVRREDLVTAADRPWVRDIWQSAREV